MTVSAAAGYRGTVTVPQDVPDDRAAVAGDSLAGVATIAPSLPTGQAQALMDSAVDAFVNGVQVVAVIGAVLYTCTGLLIVSRLKSIPPLGQPQAEAPADPPRTEST